MALGIRLADQDPLATARGNAFVATADNPSAIYYNPAGMTQITGHSARAGGYAISLNSEFTPTGGGAGLDTRDEVHVLPQLYYVFGLPEPRIAFGLGFYSPYGLALEWPDDAPFRTTARKGEITYLTLNPAAAWEFYPGLSIGGGLTLNDGEARLDQGLAVPGDEFHFEGDDQDIGFNLGLRWQPHPKHVFGLNYRSETRMQFEGTSRATLLFPGFAQLSGQARAGMTFPQFVALGWSFRPTPDWNLEFNIDWTDWDRLDVVNLEQAALPDTGLPFNWQSSFFYEWGVTRYLPNGWRVSGGYIFSENSVPDASFSPLVPDSDRHIFSAGVGRTYDRWNWDAGYQFAYGPKRTIQQPAPGVANGDYLFTSHAFALSIGYRF